jgi:hypothetical protein
LRFCSALQRVVQLLNNALADDHESRVTGSPVVATIIRMEYVDDS